MLVTRSALLFLCLVCASALTGQAIFNDTIMVFRLTEDNIAEIRGSDAFPGTRLRLNSEAHGGGIYNISTTGAGSPFGGGKLLITDGTSNTTFFGIDGDGRMGNCQDPHSSALFELRGTTGGLLLPRLSFPQQNAIPNPESGLLLWNKTANRMTYFNDTAFILMPQWQETLDAIFLAEEDQKNVGIGTDDPQSALHVIGDVTVSELGSGEAGWLFSDSSGKISIWRDTIMLANAFSSLDFVNGSGEGAVQRSFETNRIGVSLPSGSGSLFAHLDVEPGIFNDTIMVAFLDGSVSQLSFELIRMAHDGSGSTVIASHTSSGSSGNIRIVKVAIDAVYQPFDVSQYNYYLKVTSNNWSAGNLEVYGGYIRYRQPFD